MEKLVDLLKTYGKFPQIKSARMSERTKKYENVLSRWKVLTRETEKRHKNDVSVCTMHVGSIGISISGTRKSLNWIDYYCFSICFLENTFSSWIIRNVSSKRKKKCREYSCTFRKLWVVDSKNLHMAATIWLLLI